MGWRRRPRPISASRRSRLDLSEAALLAALPKAPSRLDPANDIDDALERSKVILGEMQADGWITAVQATAAVAHPPVLAFLRSPWTATSAMCWTSPPPAPATWPRTARRTWWCG